MNIIDIREKNKYNISHIPNSINIEAYELLYNADKYLNKNDTYYIYCTSGITSKKVVSNLNNRGYHTVNIDGGFNNYLLRK